MFRHFFLVWVGACALSIVNPARAQMSAADNFEGYGGNPISEVGGVGDWVGGWSTNSEMDGGVYLSGASKISGAKSLGLYGSAGTAGSSVRRAIPVCTNELSISWSMRSDVNIPKADGAPTNARRMAFTVRAGNWPSHFSDQRLSFYFAAGSTNFQWFDGSDRSSDSIPFVLGNIYDVRANLNPTNRAYSFTVSNRTSGAMYSYSGKWTGGFDSEALGSVAFLMRGPSGGGQDVFLDEVSVVSSNYSPVMMQSLPIKRYALWRYFKGRTTPALQGTNQWYRPEFDDSGWGAPKPSSFGYGPSYEITELSDMMSDYLTLFTRAPFHVANPASITRLNLAVDYDDGFVAYLNGVEIARRNMPAGPANHDTAASSVRDSSRKGMHSYNDLTWDPQEKEFIEVDPALLVAGTNVLAVSGHNQHVDSADFALLAELYANVTLTRGPFLQMPEQGRISVVWRTAAPTDSAVDYGYDLSYSGGTASNGGAVRHHEIKLPAFPPGTTVFYRVRSGGEVMLESRFVAPKAADQKFRMVVLSDYGSPSPATHKIVSLASGYDADLLITAGDNVQQGMGPVGLFDRYWFEPLAPLISKMPMMPTIGNHDMRLQQGIHYSMALSLPTNGPPGLATRNYSFNYGNAHFVMIDGNAFEAEGETAYTNRLALRDAIVPWLTNDLHHATQTWKFVVYHQPAYTTAGGHHPETAAIRDILSPIFERYGVNIAFQGHNHFYERINPVNGVYYWTVGSGGFSIHQYDSSSPKREYLASIKHQYDFLVVDVDGPHLTLRCINQDGNQLDHYDLDLSHPFAMDGILDDAAWFRAQNGLKLYAAIRDTYLYVATQDAGEGSDHFVYVADQLGAMRDANWAKAGQVMQWSAFLADENGDSTTVTAPGFTGWFNAGGGLITNFAIARAITPGLNNNGIYSNGVLEGTLNLPALLGSFPTQLWFAAAPFGTLDGEAMYSGSQVPAGNGDGDINSNEFLPLTTLSLALDLPIVNAGGASAASEEAGMPLAVTGASVQIRSSLLGSSSWSQVSGPAGILADTDTLAPSFRLTNDLAAPTAVVLRLSVFDSRFHVADEVVLNFTPIQDSDGDGLSDREETTGMDNLLTTPNPDGHLTDPNDPDSDRDGMSDGHEAIAGTDPNNENSRFELVGIQGAASTSGAMLQWKSAAGRAYHIWSATNLSAEWMRITNDLPATPPANIYTAAPSSSSVDHFRVEVITQP